MTWKNIVNLEKLEFRPDQPVPDSYEYLTDPSAFSDNMGAKKLGWNVAHLPPGKFSSPYHFHHSEEELFLVLEGNAILRQADRFREVGKGDLIFFAPGSEGAHQFFNHTGAPFKYLALSTRDELDVCEYPDSGKIKVRKLQAVFQAGAKVDYWTDEMDPAKYWPKERLK